MKGTTAFALANGYTDETVKGGGALKGKNCTIEKTEVVEGGSIVTFKWTLDDGTVQTSELFVEKGDTGYSIVGATFNSSGKLVIELSNGTFLPPVSMPTTSVEVSKAEGNILEQKIDGMYVPATDVSNFVEKELNKGLSTNDYNDIEKKQVSDNKDAINTLNGDNTTVGSVAYQIADALGKLNKLEKKIVDVLPSVEDADANAIYLLKGEGTSYEMYTLVTLQDGGKALASMGGTDIDLDGYLTEDKAKTLYLALLDVNKEALATLSLVTEDSVVYLAYNGSKILTKAQIDTLLSDYATTDYVDTELGKKVATESIVTKVDATSTDAQIPSAKTVYNELENKIDKEYGTSHKGEVLVVGEDGKVTAKTFDVINDSETATTTTWSSQKISENLLEIDDESTDEDKVWSAKKVNDSLVDIESALDDKADKSYVDDNFVTMDKIPNPYATQGNIDDANNLIKLGIWSTTSKTANLPSGIEKYGIITVSGLKTDVPSTTSQWIFQEFSSVIDGIYRRKSINPNSLNPTNWTEWVKIG